MIGLAVVLSGFTHAAAPAIAAVHLVSCEGTTLPTDVNKTVETTPTIYAVLEVARHYYCGEEGGEALPTQARIGGKLRVLERWPTAAWGTPTIAWYRIDPYQEHQETVGNATSEPQYRWYTNVVPDGPREGQWLGAAGVYSRTAEGDGCDVIEYIIPTTPFAQGWSTHGYYQYGTMRFQARVTLPTGAFASPGAFDPATISHLVYRGRGACYRRGITEAVHRVSCCSSDPNRYLAYLDAYITVPWLYGSMGLSLANEQTERFVGADCADLLIGAARAAGLTRCDYTDAQNLAQNNRYTKPRVPYKILRNAYDQLIDLSTGQEVTLALEDGPEPRAMIGDLVMIDFDNDGKFEHSTVIRRDLNGNHLLELTDILVFMYHGGQSENPLGAEVQRGDAFRLRHW